MPTPSSPSWRSRSSTPPHELVHSAPSQGLSVQAAPAHLRGRYLSSYQLSWSLCRTTAPLLLGFLLDAGQWQLWTVLALLVLTGAAVLLYAERALPAHVISTREVTTAPQEAVT